MPDWLTEAGAASRRDLETTGQWTVLSAAGLRSSVEARQWWLAQWPEGGEHLEGLVAQDVQEWVHDHVDSDWPLCPEHRDHALFVEPDLGPDPFWVCHRSGLPLARVGELPVESQ
ncbi:MAG: hypothetical protein QOI76_1369 [Frankiales bacterium]|nr:hypothetical protein [Frankiales bacterium]